MRTEMKTEEDNVNFKSNDISLADLTEDKMVNFDIDDIFDSLS
jgi:hypothetical protein